MEANEYNRELEFNEKLLGYNGFIGRHGFFLNLVKILMITEFFMLPIIIFSFLYSDNPLLFDTTKMYWYAPMYIQIPTIIGCLIFSVLFILSMTRRLNDIFGQVNKVWNIIFSIIIFIAGCNLIPGIFDLICNLYFIIFTLILLIKKGKISSSLPYDYKKEFNWGAFFGTWIWGIVNKSFVPFWALLLHFTPIGFFFKLFCGLKGNEWAYKNKKWTDVDKFNQNQKIQSIIFTILSFVVFPLISFFIILILIFIAAFIFSVEDYENNMEKQIPVNSVQIEDNTDNAFESFLVKIVNFMAYVNFEKYEITENENKFYILPSDWKYSTFSDKRELLDEAATISAEYKYQLCKKQQKTNCYHSTKNDELPKTKIYNIKNNQILGEFFIDPAVENCDNCKLTDYLRYAFDAYKFYNVDD